MDEQPDYLCVISETLLAIYYETRFQAGRPAAHTLAFAFGGTPTMKRPGVDGLLVCTCSSAGSRTFG